MSLTLLSQSLPMYGMSNLNDTYDLLTYFSYLKKKILINLDGDGFHNKKKWVSFLLRCIDISLQVCITVVLCE